MNAVNHQTRVLIVGAGVAGLEGALALKQHAGERVQTTLLSHDNEFLYRPVSVGEPFGHKAARSYPLTGIVADLGIEHCTDTLKWVDIKKRVVHTEEDLELEYDALLLAVGARTSAPMAHALTIDPYRIDEQLHGLIQDVDGGWAHRIAFIIPELTSWPLPIYELALMTATRAYEMNLAAQITVVTPEHAPLAIFGSAASYALSRRLEEHRIVLITSASCGMHEANSLTVSTRKQPLAVDQVVTLPALSGPAVPGIPRSAAHGFITVDRHGHVPGVDRVFAAGDMTNFPIKLGGIAAQQADTAAESIAALAGAPIEPKPLVATIHGMLLGGGEPLYMEARVTGSQGSSCRFGTKPLWGTDTKINARYLTPYLQSLDAAATAS